MFSKILVKLIDQAIIPALVLLTTRIVSVTLLSNYLGIPFQFSGRGFIFDDQTQYLKVNSYSLLVMVIVLSLGLLFFLLKAYIFHESHITPKMTATLFSIRLPSLIQSSYEVYTKGAIWISYSFLMLMVTGALSLYGYCYAWVFYTSLGVSILSLLLFIFDVENEMKLGKQDGFDEDVTYLEVNTRA